MRTHDKISVTDKMVGDARERWPDAIYFDFVECTGEGCSFVGLVQITEEICPECQQDSLKWADGDQKEFSL